MASTIIQIYSTNSATFTCSGSSVAVTSYNSSYGVYMNRCYISSGSLVAPTISGYTFAGWYTFPSDSTSLRDDMPTRATTLLSSSASVSASTVTSNAKKNYNSNLLCYAKYNASSGRTVTLSASPSSGGTVSGGGTKYDGETFTITATPSTGYLFMYWEHNGSQVSTSSTYQFTASSSTAGTYTAYFRTSGPISTGVIRVACDYSGTFTYTPWTVSVSTYDSYLPGYYGKISDSGVNLTAATISGALFQDWRTFPSDSSTIRDDYLSRATTVLSYNNYLSPEQIRSAKLSNNGDYFIYARYSAAYTLTYDGNGGTPGETSETKVAGSSFILPNATRTGYTFDGWYTATSGGTRVGGSGSSYTPIASETLHAQWTIVSYTISYSLNGGTAGTNKPTNATYGSWANVSLPTRTDYTFAGWTITSGLNTSTAQYSVVLGTAVNITSSTQKCGAGYSSCSFCNLRITTGSVTLTANWTGQTYTVTFNDNGGSGGPGSATVSTGNYLTIPLTLPTKSGATCKGWSKVKDSGIIDYVAGKQYYYDNFKTSPTLYAVWSGNSILITLNANGGSLPSGTSPFIVKTVGATIGTLPTPTSTTSFLGWFTAASGGTQVTSSTTVSTSLSIIYAHWSTTQTYTVTFVDPTGTNTTSVRTFTRDVATALPWINSGLGWTTPTGRTVIADATWATSIPDGTKYANNATVTNLAAANENIDLYANWGTSSYTVTFNPNGGTVQEASRIVSYGNMIGTLPDVTYSSLFNYSQWKNTSSKGLQGGNETAAGFAIDDRDGSIYFMASVAHTYTKYGASSAYYNVKAYPSRSYRVTYDFIGTATSYEIYYVCLDSSYAIIYNGTRPYTGCGQQVKDKTFTTPANTAYIQLFVDIHTQGQSGKFLNIKLIESAFYPGPKKIEGWYTAASGGTKISATQTVTSNATYYAHWETATYVDGFYFNV